MPLGGVLKFIGGTVFGTPCWGVIAQGGGWSNMSRFCSGNCDVLGGTLGGHRYAGRFGELSNKSFCFHGGCSRLVLFVRLVWP